MSLTKVTNSMIVGAPLKPSDFGAVGDGITDDSAAIRLMWLSARNNWFDNGVPAKIDLSGTYYLASPVEDLANVAIFIMDFAGDVTASQGGYIKVGGSSTGYIFQIGTYDSRNSRMGFFGVTVESDTGTHAGFMFANCFQSQKKADNLTALSCTTTFALVNCQELFVDGWKSKDSTNIALHLTASGATRAEGSDGSYSSSTAFSANNNNHINISIQSPAGTGYLHEAGVGNLVTGLGQGDTATGEYMVDISGGSSIAIRDFYIEQTAIHRELIVKSGFTGSVILDNVYAATTGSILAIEGGNVFINGGSSWTGKLLISNDAAVFTDALPLAGYQSGSQLAFVGTKNLPVLSATSSLSDVDPQNRRRFYKGVIASGGTNYVDFFSGGSNASGNETKGFIAKVHVWEQGTTNQCTSIFYVDGRATYPNTRSVIEEKLGTLAGANAQLTAPKSGGTPYHIIIGRLTNLSVSNDLSYEIIVEPFEF